MSKLYLDTNVLYQLLGFSKNSRVKSQEALKQFIFNSEVVYLPSVVVCEILVKYKNNADKLQKILHLINNPPFKIVNSGHCRINLELPLFSLVDVNQIKLNLLQISTEIHILLGSKVFYEVFFTRLFLRVAKIYVAFLICVKFYGSNFIEPFALCKDIITYNDTEDTEKAMLWDLFVVYLTKDAKGHDEYLRKVFSKDISLFVEIITSALEERSADKKDIRVFLSSIEDFIEEEQPLKILRKLEKMKYLDKPERTDDENEDERRITEKDINKQVREYMLSVLTKNGNSVHFAQYTMMMLDQWRDGGNKFDKNNVGDMIILTSLDDPDSEMLLFDDNSYNYLQTIAHPSTVLIDRFYNMKELK